MGQRTKRLAVTVSLTVLDAVVAGYYGGVVWRAFSGIIWSKLLLFLLAALWATSLLNLWTGAYHDLCKGIRDRGVVAVSIPMKTLTAKLVEDSDV